MTKNPKIHVNVFGCSANVADYEIVSGLLKQSGFELVDDSRESDLNIILTCDVKTPTMNRMVHMIKELVEIGKPLVIAGCMPKSEREIIEKIAPEASLLGPDSIQDIVDVVKRTYDNQKVVSLKDHREPKLCLPRVRKNDVIHITPISIGCLSSCAYCITRFARGKLFSYPTDMILKDVKEGLKEGCEEVWITSQDCGCWGIDRGLNLSDLLDAIDEIEGKFFVRVGMMNPTHVKDFVDNLINSYKSEKIFKFLHLPLQSGSSKILKSMNRGYSVEEFENIVKKFRKKFSYLTLSTDVIVGFPGEDERDFQKIIELIEEVEPDIVNISKFGARRGTKAAKMEQLPKKTIEERTKKLVEIIDRIKSKKNKRWLGWQGEVLIDEKGKKDSVIGRNFAYKPVVTEGKIGTFKEVKIIEAHPTYLVGK